MDCRLLYRLLMLMTEELCRCRPANRRHLNRPRRIHFSPTPSPPCQFSQTPPLVTFSHLQSSTPPHHSLLQSVPAPSPHLVAAGARPSPLPLSYVHSSASYDLAPFSLPLPLLFPPVFQSPPRSYTLCRTNLASGRMAVGITEMRLHHGLPDKCPASKLFFARAKVR